MKFQRGFLQVLIGGWAYLVYALAIAAFLFSVYQFIDNNWETDAGIKRGKEIKQSEWDKANKKAEDDRKEQRAKDAEIVADLDAKRLKAERAALDWERKWREAYNAWNRAKVPLTSTNCPKSDQPADTRFTWAFVGLYDSAHARADSGGQPIFGNPDTIAAAGPGPSASSPYGPQEVLDVHKANADRWTQCRRDLNYLIDVVDKLQRTPRIAP
jgi:hypothetical protein